MFKKTPLAILTFFLLFQIGKSQISYKNRLEFESKNGYDNERILEFGENGFIIASKSYNINDNKREWKYEKFDVNLNSVKSKSVFLNKKLFSDESYESKSETHRFFRDRKGNFTLVSVNAKNLKVTKASGVLPKKTYISDMAVIGDYAFFKAISKKEPFLFSVNWKNGDKKLIPLIIDGVKMKKVSVKNFQVSEENDEIYVYIKVPKSKKESDLHVMRLNNIGGKKDQFNLTANIDKNIVEITASKVKNDKYVYTGTYSSKSGGTSQGLFFCTAKKGKVENIEFYNFLDLKNFLSFLPEKKQEKIKNKQKRKANKGKELSINYSISPHDIIETEDGYLFLGEAYYPTYRTETYTTTTYSNGQAVTVTRTRTVFDGYQYTHATLAKFNKQGKLIWDQTFEMWPSFKPFFVKRFISISEKNKNSIKLVFSDRNTINTKSFYFDGRIKKDSKSDEISTGREGDNIKYTFSNLDYWYDSYFLAYGNQKIKNKEAKGKKKRKVFFISKIQYQ